ncbi:transposase [Streptomyces canus]|uniref:IS1182 family transposase n=1 Tax=Streptomyces canus TaxID=58343 RepID=UPI0027860B38|nr:IS1182 family transposase [Streptomyces canus]MDQ0605399.1 transposase [Streptomyces canus]
MTARVTRASNPQGTTAMWVRDRLDGLWCDEDFTAWYPRDGRPGLSPAQLATVCVLQFLLNLSDRQAAEAVRCRLDFKYALGLELDDPGSHHSVLGDFRDRLARGDRADQLLDLALARLAAAGLVKQRGRQRTDSTHVLAAARDLTRLELVLEAVRAALEELARDAPELLDPLVTAEWAERYGRPVRLCSQPSHPIARLTEAGADAHALLALARAPDRATGPAREVLRQILVQQFIVDERGRLRPRADKDGFPPGGRQIRSPYDLDTRFALRGNTRWSGYLLHVTETCDFDRPNVITDVATTVPTRDTAAVPGIHTRLNKRCLLPAEHLLDGGYLSVALLDQSDRTYGVTLIGPVKASGQWQHKEQTGFARDDFTIDFANRQVTCPRGQTAKSWVEAPAQAPYISARFRPRHCDPCPTRSLCARGRAARTVYFLPQQLHELQARSRADQQDPAWRQLYAVRSGVEGTIAELALGHRARRCRFHGLPKTHVQHVLTAIAVNIERLAEQDPQNAIHRPRRPTAFQQYLVSHGFPRPLWWRQGK